MKIFTQEIQKFYDKLVSGEKFSFSKYADGEWMAMQGQFSTPGNGEWHIGPDTQISRDMLIESFRYKDPGYYVGISCPCCQGDNHYYMKDFSGQDEDHLTFANLFVNSNYQFFIDNFIPEFAKREIVLVANYNSLDRLKLLPFKVTDFHAVDYDAWVQNLDLIDFMQKQRYNNKLILFSCGPLGNILAHKLWQENKNNTYIDVGSTLDLWLGNDVRNKRCYAVGIKSFSEKVCHWG